MWLPSPEQQAWRLSELPGTSLFWYHHLQLWYMLNMPPKYEGVVLPFLDIMQEWCTSLMLHYEYVWLELRDKRVAGLGQTLLPDLLVPHRWMFIALC